MKKLKLFSAVLAAGMVLTATATGCKSKTTDPKSGYPTDGRVYNDFKVGGQAILGSDTQLSGEFRVRRSGVRFNGSLVPNVCAVLIKFHSIVTS